MDKYNMIKYASHAAFGYFSLLAYDTLVLGFKIDGGFVMSDATSFALSTVLTNFSCDVLSSMVPYINDGSFIGMISCPLINGIIYSYVYDMMTNRRYPGIRDPTNTFLVGSVGLLLTRYIESPVLSLFGLKSY